jgi:hypothetical protein
LGTIFRTITGFIVSFEAEELFFTSIGEDRQSTDLSQIFGSGGYRWEAGFATTGEARTFVVSVCAVGVSIAGSIKAQAASAGEDIPAGETGFMLTFASLIWIADDMTALICTAFIKTDAGKAIDRGIANNLFA